MVNSISSFSEVNNSEWALERGSIQGSCAHKSEINASSFKNSQKLLRVFDSLSLVVVYLTMILSSTLNLAFFLI